MTDEEAKVLITLAEGMSTISARQSTEACAMLEIAFFTGTFSLARARQDVFSAHFAARMVNDAIWKLIAIQEQ